MANFYQKFIKGFSQMEKLFLNGKRSNIGHWKFEKITFVHLHVEVSKLHQIVWSSH
jgi:hypothetical protein